METMVGRIVHYYPKVNVAVVILEDHLAYGDMIHIRGHREDFHQIVNSMELNHEPVTEADGGQDIGIRVNQRVHEGDIVFRET